MRKTAIFSMIFPAQKFLQGEQLTAGSNWRFVSAYNPVHQRMRKSCDKSPLVKEDELAHPFVSQTTKLCWIYGCLRSHWNGCGFSSRKAGEDGKLDDDHTKCSPRFKALWYHNLTEESRFAPGPVCLHISHPLEKQLCLERKSNDILGLGKK